MKLFKIVFFVGALCFGFNGIAANETSPIEPIKDVNWKALSQTPTLHGGRIKPFDEFAREITLLLTGGRSYKNYDPSEFVISLMVRPDEWADQPIIRISNEEVKKQLLLSDKEGKFFSPNELLHNNVFLQYAESVLSKDSSKQVTSKGIDVVTAAQNPRAEEFKRVVDRVSIFQALVQGKMWAVTPSTALDTPWGNLGEGMQYPTDQTKIAYEVLRAYLDRNPADLNQKIVELKASIIQAMSSTPYQYHEGKISAEVLYNKMRPFLQAMILYLLAGLAWMFVGLHPIARLVAKSLTFIAVFVHVFGFALRMYISERAPVTNMYESIIWVSLGVVAFAFILFYKFKAPLIMVTSTLISGFALFAADAAPLVMDPTIRPLVPVLRSNYWLTIHVLTITASYAAFFLAMGISNYTLFLFLKKKRAGVNSQSKLAQGISQTNLISYKALQIGTVLLAAGTILGGIWADYSWGRFWGWDPKEVWALIAFLVYMAVLHGRFTGWINSFTFPFWTVLCFSTVVMAWYGVNFVLGVGLHSYGFSTGGQAFVASFLGIQLVYAVAVLIDHKIGSRQVEA